MLASEENFSGASRFGDVDECALPGPLGRRSNGEKKRPRISGAEGTPDSKPRQLRRGLVAGDQLGLLLCGSGVAITSGMAVSVSVSIGGRGSDADHGAADLNEWLLGLL